MEMIRHSQGVVRYRCTAARRDDGPFTISDSETGSKPERTWAATVDCDCVGSETEFRSASRSPRSV